MIKKIKNTNINILNGGYNNKSESPTVFLIHGAGMNATVWQMQTRYLASKGINVLAIDLPGHGSSEGNGLETIEDMALWVIELINELKITHAIIAGHSMGSLIGIEAAKLNNKNVKGLILLGTSSSMPVLSLIHI